MPRPGFLRHRKLLKAAKLCGVPKYAMLGLIQMIWEYAYDTGDPYIGQSDDLEVIAEWDGEEGRLTRALANCGTDSGPGLIERVEGKPEHWQVHDLYDHAPEYVRRRWSREQERRVKGKSVSGHHQVIDKSVTDHGTVNVESLTAETVVQDGLALTPLPNPTPRTTPNKDKDTTSAQVARKARSRVDYTEPFEAFWKAYPNQKAKGDAWKAWLRMAEPVPSLRELLEAVSRASQSRQWVKDGGQFIPAPAKWLRGRSWEDGGGAVPLTPTQCAEAFVSGLPLEARSDPDYVGHCFAEIEAGREPRPWGVNDD